MKNPRHDPITLLVLAMVCIVAMVSIVAILAVDNTSGRPLALGVLGLAALLVGGVPAIVALRKMLDRRR